MGPLYRNFATVEELDAQYALQDTVDDFPGYLASYRRRSDRTRSRLPARLGLAYGPTTAERFDLFPGVEGAPVVVFIHGGYWHSGSKEEWSFVAQGLVDRGVSVVVSDYALCPTVSMAEIVRQHRALVAHLWRSAAELGIDRERIVVTGHSAGGHAAACVAATDWSAYELPATTVAATVAISGVFDLRPLPFTFLAPRLQLTRREVDELSPVLHPPTHHAPMLVTYGTQETAEFQRQSAEFAAVYRAAGGDPDLLALPRNHYDVVDDLADPDRPIARWVLSHL